MDYKIPDLRFEETFVASLNAYAHPEQAAAQAKSQTSFYSRQKRRHKHELTDEELDLQPKPLPIPTSVVLYAIIKDQIVSPLLSGFLWTGILMVCGPILWQITNHGQRCGIWLANILHLNGGPPSFLKPKFTTV
ncbi:hypothetical protein PGUG_05394 [Meyerozyma guilliermondii ATCC 6260]|uniref:Uncharacterized protein n=1 Tax=Meyerozyma guilliermondii (strain ATCC 6260 / CBS 566 / DSM 6381 / JCM 1539 / NBRC 10279 / NRRL Y-324) TaxID=294746 RepID=A5DQ43_PICGU|nr:uncharacterized protein PGUG_05394 [Meyerozyma guilliermondii ATCC 6260]EDK41296.2 hypothetical protein PGUG_05394 [Meyerozyma guilliermondii ATCC 6260]